MNEQQRSEWLQGRRQGIGGSDVAAVLGLSPWKTALDVWNDKLGLSEEKGMSEPAYWGTTLEDTVAKEFQKRTGYKVQRVDYQFSDPENSWMIANIDRAIINPNIAARVRPLTTEKEVQTYAKISGVERPINTDIAFEAKTASTFMSHLWGPSQELEIQQHNIKTEHVIPLYYETQVQWYCGILKLRGMFLGVLIGGADYRLYWIEARPDVFEAIKEKCKTFWFENVLQKIPPEPANIKDVLKLYGRSNGETLEAQGDLVIDVGELVRVDSQIQELNKEKDALKNKVSVQMKAFEAVSIGGETVITFKQQTSRRFDIEKFKREHLDLYLAYLKETSTRVMRLKE